MLSIVVPTTRDISILRTSLDLQTSKRFEVLVQREEGLVAARNAGWRRAKGDIVAFIDDDVFLNTNWVEEIQRYFSNSEVVAVIGGVITQKGNRDNDWSNPILVKFFDRIGGIQACNMAFRRSVLEQVGGFDEVYSKGVGEWSEPDLVYKVKKIGLVLHNNKAMLLHTPSKQGIYQQRGEHSYWRMRNFKVFCKRWLKWDFNLLQVFVIFNIYWIYKFFKTGNIGWLGGIYASIW